MTTNVFILPKVDMTGTDPDNFVSEIHAPQPGLKRLIIPRFGDFFFNDALKLFDAVNGDEIPRTKWRPRDLVNKKSLDSKDAVYSVLELDGNTPSSIRVEAQHYGGEESLSALAVLTWIDEHITQSPTFVPYSELLNTPKLWNPAHHKHLLDHIYWMNPLVASLKRVANATLIGSSDAIEHTRTAIEMRMTGLRQRAELTIEGLVHNRLDKWRADLDTYHMGLDLINNMGIVPVSLMEAAAAPDFTKAMVGPELDAYVDLYGLEGFCKKLFETITRDGTGLGKRVAMLRDPTRGNVLAALNGEVYQIPAKHTTLNALSRWPWIWPEGYPENDPFVITKICGNESDFGGVFQGFNPKNGDSWVGLLRYHEYAFKLDWMSQYNEASVLALPELYKKHFDEVGAAHGETAADLGLGELEGCTLVSVDEILSRTANPKALHTMETFMGLIRAYVEGVILPVDENGQVDLEKNPMIQPKIIYAPCEAPDYTIKTPESTFCDKLDLWGRFKDPAGIIHEVLIQKDSKSCEVYEILKHGTPLGEFCEQVTFDKKARFADGRGGTYVDTIEFKSVSCGYIPVPKEGEILAEYCSGKNRMRDIATGTGEKRTVMWMENTYLCDGDRGEPSSGTGGTGGTPSTKNKKIVFASSHTNIYVGTVEMLKGVFTGFDANTTYSGAIWVQTSVAYNGKPNEQLIFTFKTNDKGEYIYELPRTDLGIVPRGDWETWLYVESSNVESNHVVRKFLAGNNPGDGNPDVTLPTDPTSPTGPGKDIDGAELGPGPWPPRPRYNPTLSLETNRPIIYPNDTETLVATAKYFYANKSYTLKFFATFSDGRTVKTHETVMSSNGMEGGFIYTIHLFDDGATVPRGECTNWIEVDEYRSPSLVRTFMPAGSGTGNPVNSAGLLYTISHNTIGIGTTYTETIILTKLKPSTKYAITIKAGYYDGWMMGGVRAELVMTTDSNGAGRWERTLTETGTTVQSTQELTAYAQEGGQTITSNKLWVSWTGRDATTQPGTGVPKIDYSTDKTIIKKGTIETHTVRLSNATPSTKYSFRYVIQSPALNGNQPFVTTTRSATTNLQGTATDTLTNTDDGTSVPRGDYLCWVEVVEITLKSSVITRSFVNEDGSTTPTPTTGPKTITFSTSHPTIQPGTNEVQTVSITGFAANKTFAAKLIIRSDALQNGGQNVQTAVVAITTNAQGSGSGSFNIVDNGQAPRGAYQCWATIDDISSNVVTRTLIGAPVNFNPKITYSTSHTTIQAGITEQQTLSVTGAMPNTRYTLEYWGQGAALYNNQPYRGNPVSVVTNADGAASYTLSTYDDGLVIPRGIYYSWGVIQELGTKSASVMRNFIGTVTTTSYRFDPVVSYWTDRSTIYVGTSETHNYTIGGAMPNTRYGIELWISGAGVGGTMYMTTKYLTTNSTGNAAGSFTNSDNGVTPRGSYSCWVVLEGYSSVRSSPVTRVFI